MSANAFSLVYDGPPVAEGTIDARDLAPALLALADLIDEAAPVVDPELPRLSLRVRPDFREGSFEVYLELANLYSKFVSLFSGPDAQAWASFLQINLTSPPFTILTISSYTGVRSAFTPGFVMA